MTAAVERVEVGFGRRIPWMAVATLGALGYTVLLGGTGRGELDGLLRLVNGALAAVFIGTYALRAPTNADRVDKGVLTALLLFLGAAIFSWFPRQAFDAALGALAAAAYFFVARGQLHLPAVRLSLERMLIGLSVVMTLLTAAYWLPTFLEWWALAGWNVLPPLDLNLSSSPWGHRHDLALLVVLLYPTFFIGPISPIRRVLALVMAPLVILIVFVDGSRNLWSAILIASILLASRPTLRLVRNSPRARIAALVFGLAVVGTLLVSGLGLSLVERLASLESLEFRSAMWGSLLEAWAERPLAGYGPGSFPWILQTTTYFDTNSWAPRHPDSAIFQLLGEGGVLGVVSALILFAVLARPLLRSPSRAAQWALITFLVAGIGANPTDFAFLVIVAIAWTAYAVPRGGTPADPRARPVWGRLASAAGLLVIAAAYLTTAVASSWHDTARQSVDANDFGRAAEALDAAVTLDPGMALYWRDRGTLRLLSGNPDGASHDLEAATRLNPSDSVAWRILALAARQGGDRSASDQALLRALALRRSDPSTLLLQARWAAELGDTPKELTALSEVVQAWPAVVGAAGWDRYLTEALTSADIVDEAVSRWESGKSSLEPFSVQALWLAAMANRPDLLPAAVETSNVGDQFAHAVLATLACDPAASQYLEDVASSDRRNQLYWQMRIRQAAVKGDFDETSMRLVHIIRGEPLDPSRSEATLNPLLSMGFNLDIYGYRRRPIAWPDPMRELPSPRTGELRWLFDPLAAIDTAGLQSRVPNCR